MTTEIPVIPNANPETAPVSQPAATPAPHAAASQSAADPASTVAVAAAKHQASAPVAVPDLKAEARDDSASAGRSGLMSGASARGRFPLLAASIAVAAAFGSIVGAGAFTAGSHLLAAPPAPAPVVKAEPHDDTKELHARVAQLRTSVKGLTDSVAALRTTAETSGKATAAQLAKVTEQLAKLGEAVERTERAQAEPAARLSKAAEALERRAQVQPEITGSVPAPRSEPPKPPIVSGWLLRSVIDGVALLEGHDRVIEVEAGDNIRGVGRVEDVRRQDGRWVVVTSKGLIVARR